MTLVDIRSGTITKKGQIVIPKSMRKKEGFKEGSKIAILAFEDKVVLRAIDKIDEKMSSALASEKVLAEEWDTKEEDEAWKDL